VELRVNVEKRFGNFGLHADFAVSGDRVGVFGESGSGKSTLVGMVAGLCAPDAGEIVLDGERLYSSGDRVDIPVERRHVAVVFQQPSLFPHLSVRSNLLYGYKRRPAAERAVDFSALVEALRLEGLLTRGVNNLSGGEKQRVALGRAVLSSPRLLLMDEPLSALGDGLKFQIIPFLKGVSQRFRIPFLFISHSLVEMRLMADKVLVVADGRVAEPTTADALARSRMGSSPVGYINLLTASSPRRIDGLFAYEWGGQRLLISAGTDEEEGTFELSSKDIILFKQHPEAISARNLFRCTVSDTFAAGNRIGAELTVGDRTLVAEMTGQAAQELGIARGCEIFAAIKASAFRRLGG
jgi:molybdate transport system ATP-binding protein